MGKSEVIHTYVFSCAVSLKSMITERVIKISVVTSVAILNLILSIWIQTSNTCVSARIAYRSRAKLIRRLTWHVRSWTHQLTFATFDKRFQFYKCHPVLTDYHGLIIYGFKRWLKLIANNCNEARLEKYRSSF